MNYKTIHLIFTIIGFFLISSQFLAINCKAGEAGVGVINVPPKFTLIRIVQQDDFIRVYLTLSDYNSWADIYNVSITLEDNGVNRVQFLFQQYEDIYSYNSINKFSQSFGGNNILNLEKCSYFHSVKKDTVDDRCDLQLLFVFETTFFTRFHLIVRDRAGETAESHIDYNAAEMTRDNDVIIIPGLNGELYRIWLPQFILEILAILAATAGTMYIAKKRKITLFKRVKHEKG
ncbi:MAG: hypothetical protein JXA91_04775 [Candidatus Thermoplasmatota archaeon]|nr:hypothetical protein [Candidatus Thermoplasmatota archaeon]